MTLRVLLVSYQFPPTGGAGVGRALKLCKYLPAAGIEPTVLTVSNPSVPSVDDSLCSDIPDLTRVVSVPTLEPGYRFKQLLWKNKRTGAAPGGTGDSRGRALVSALRSLPAALLVPDPQILWLPGAVIGALGMSRPDVVWITAPPFSQFLLAPLLRRLWSVPVVLDYRDEWTTCRTTYEMASALGRRSGEALERALLPHAEAVTVATEAFRSNLLSRFSELDGARVHAIPNGFDPDDFPSSLPAPPDDKLTLTYAGTVFRLTRPAALLAALERLEREKPGVGSRIRIRFVGRVVDTELAALDAARPLGVELLGYRDKRSTMDLLAASHFTLCILDGLDVNRSICPAKLYELMMLGRPCLTIAPDGQLEQLARRHRLGPVFGPADATAIAGFLGDAIEKHAAGRLDVGGRAVDIDRFDRRVTARTFAQLFAAVSGRRPLAKGSALTQSASGGAGSA